MNNHKFINRLMDKSYNALDAIFSTDKKNIMIVGYEISHEISLMMSLLWIPLDFNKWHVTYIGINEFLKIKDYDVDNTFYVVIALGTMNYNNDVTIQTIHMQDINSGLLPIQCLFITIYTKPFEDVTMLSLFCDTMVDYIAKDCLHNARYYPSEDDFVQDLS